jgi:N-acetylglucosaminyldiphosphoundecaprenol N-acetyl-beta-D-mannosaminyltransferase
MNMDRYRMSAVSTAEAVYFLGYRFDTGSIDSAIDNILAETAGRFKYMVTPNVQHMVRLLENPATLRPLYERAWRVFCDSRVLSLLARLNGQRLPVITGSDLTAQIIARASEQRLRIALIGPTASAVATLQRRYPGLDVVLHTPPMGFITSEHEVQKCVDFVVEAQAPMTFLAVGMPQQEILASHIMNNPEARGVGLCIGASIDFLTGKQRRAPVWVQKAGLEWLHRLLSDPRRLASRYLVECPRIFYLMWSMRRKDQLPSRGLILP